MENNNMKLRSSICLALLVFAPLVAAQPARIDPAGIDGALLLCGSYKATPAMFEKFVELAGGAKAKIVIVTFAKAKWETPPRDGLSAAAKKVNAAEPTVIDYADIKGAFPQATGIWMHVDSVSPMQNVMNDGKLAVHCRAVLKNGGVIGSGAAGTRYVATRELARNTVPCMNLLPDSLITIRQKGKPSTFSKGTSTANTLVAYEIEDDSAMLVKGRTISALGTGSVQVHLPGGKTPPREIVSERNGKNDPRRDKEDLTALRRAAFDRATGFPPKKVEEPFVEKGTLVIVGGGGSPDGLYPKFIDYAGGKGKAVIAIFPTANEGKPNRDIVARAFEKAGAKKATVLYGRTLAEVESKEFLDTLKEATGLWFDGGRQWRFVDCYENTKALPLMFDVLRRDGVIGGTSAGATIQGEYLARGGVFNNFDIRYEGYERGLGFLKGVAIDQHFSKRNRLPEMTQLMKIHPQYLGIGIDEATAIVVKGSIADVIGRGKVHFYDTNRKVESGEPDYQALSAGGQYDLRARKVLAEGK
jgi:cyanophycinase